jgi:UDP-N-acetyl-D-galactosamine dehydrogenase
MLKRGMQPLNSRILVLGLTFKENCPDVRNTKVIDVVRELESYGSSIDVYDPWVDADEVRHEYGITPCADPAAGTYDVVLIAVAHNQFRKLGHDGIRAFGKAESLLYDIKYLLPADASDDRL